jgi:adenylate cyclase
MSKLPEQDPRIEEIWRTYMTTGKAPDYVPQPWYQAPSLKRFVRQVPEDPRCHYCHYPFEGVGGKLAKAVLGIERSRLNPHMCNICERFAEDYQGGTEMEMTLLFADVRGSTALAEKMSALEFSQLIDRFYRETTHAIFHAGGMVEKLVGDEVTAFFVPAFSGPNHARTAVEVGKAILQATGHGDQEGPWIPVGVGVHTGLAYVGTVGERGSNLDIVVLGDNVNVAARLAGVAGAGELVMSEATRAAAALDSTGMAHRWFDLKGKEEAVEGWVYGRNTGSV